MNCYNLKINGKYIEKIEETDIPQSFRGNWYNHTKQHKLKPFYAKSKDSHKVIEGYINLKSHLDMIIDIERDGIYKINKIEIIKKDNK